MIATAMTTNGTTVTTITGLFTINTVFTIRMSPRGFYGPFKDMDCRPVYDGIVGAITAEHCFGYHMHDLILGQIEINAKLRIEMDEGRNTLTSKFPKHTVNYINEIIKTSVYNVLDAALQKS